jgi:hypothetical protein
MIRVDRSQKVIVDPSKIIRIETTELPKEHAKGEGEYEVRYGHKPKDYEIHDVISLEKLVLSKVFKDQIKVEQILDRLQNFRVLIINLKTQEVTIGEIGALEPPI